MTHNLTFIFLVRETLSSLGISEQCTVVAAIFGTYVSNISILEDRMFVFLPYRMHMYWVWVYSLHYRNAQAGFVNGSESYLLPGSGTENVTLLNVISNIGVPGAWLFRLHDFAPGGMIVTKFCTLAFE